MYHTQKLLPVKCKKVLLDVDSPFQNIRYEMTNQGLVLFLNEEIQFVENEERVYHHALAGVPLLRKKDGVNRVLILGGGDGLAARTIFEFNPSCRVDLCELDPVVLWSASSISQMAKLNKNSISRVNVFLGDAKYTIRQLNQNFYDVVVYDFPDLKVDTMGLYDPQMFWHVHRVLRKNGIISVYPGGQYWMIQDLLQIDFVKQKNTLVNIKTMGQTPIISAVRR